MAGISKLHTLAAIITPAAKPKKAFCTFSLCPSFLMKKTTAAPNVVIENVYTHAWIDDNTLVIMSTNGKKDKILYTKLNAEDLTILAEGELNIPAPTNWLKLTSSGILTYRKS